MYMLYTCIYMWYWSVFVYWILMVLTLSPKNVLQPSTFTHMFVYVWHLHAPNYSIVWFPVADKGLTWQNLHSDFVKHSVCRMCAVFVPWSPHMLLTDLSAIEEDLTTTIKDSLHRAMYSRTHRTAHNYRHYMVWRDPFHWAVCMRTCTWWNGLGIYLRTVKHWQLPGIEPGTSDLSCQCSANITLHVPSESC